jgi:hypothetical protein
MARSLADGQRSTARRNDRWSASSNARGATWGRSSRATSGRPTLRERYRLSIAAKAWFTDVGAHRFLVFTWRLYSRTAESRTRPSDSASAPCSEAASQETNALTWA